MSSMELWWLGQSGVRLRDPAGGPVVFVDPFLSPHQGRSWDAPLDPDELARQADVILCTHQHLDHFDQPTLRAAAAVPGARLTLVVPRPIVQMALDLGIPGERVIGAQPEQSLEVAGVPVHPVPARHGVDVSDAYTFGEQLSGGLVRYLGYVIELGGVPGGGPRRASPDSHALGVVPAQASRATLPRTPPSSTRGSPSSRSVVVDASSTPPLA